MNIRSAIDLILEHGQHYLNGSRSTQAMERLTHEAKPDAFSKTSLSLESALNHEPTVPFADVIAFTTFAERVHLQLLEDDHTGNFYGSGLDECFGALVFSLCAENGVDLEDDNGYCLKATPSEICIYNISRLLAAEYPKLGRPGKGEKAILVVPKLSQQKTWSACIDLGSAIVAFAHKDKPAKVTLYFESNRHNFDNVNSFEDQAVIAYGRMVESYPTIARAMGNTDEFVAVGTVSYQGIDLDRNVDFDAWLSHRPGLAIESSELALKRLYPR